MIFRNLMVAGIVMVFIISGSGCAEVLPNPPISITMNQSFWGGFWIQIHNRSNSRIVARIHVTSADGNSSTSASFGISPNGTADADLDSMGGWTFEDGEHGTISVDGYTKKLYFSISGNRYEYRFDR